MATYIICPNCGASNEHRGNCDFCGAPLIAPQTEVQSEEESFIDGLDRSTSFKVEDLREVEVDSRVLSTDRITTTLKVLVNEYGKIQLGLRELELTFEHVSSVNFCIISGRFYKFYVDNKNISKFNEDGFHSLWLNKFTLKSICQAKRISFWGDRIIYDKENIIPLIAQLFYHTFYDNNSYEDAADRVYQLVYNERFDERIFERYYTVNDNGIKRHELKKLIIQYDWCGRESGRTNKIDGCEITLNSDGGCKLYIDYRASSTSSKRIVYLNDSVMFKEGELSQDDLLILCKAKKITHEDGTEIRGLSLMAQVLYHAIYDPNAYPEAAGDFYNLCQSINEVEKKKALEIQREKAGGVIEKVEEQTEKQKKKGLVNWLMDIFCNV